MKNRKDCEHYSRCGRTGHYFDGERWKRCECLIQERNRRMLGTMFTEDPVDHTKLTGRRKENLVLTGPLAQIRKHVARVLLDMVEEGKTWLTMDVYRLIEIFLDQDKELDTLAATIEKDLLILLVGFGDPKNKYLPELLLQATSRRELLGKPTWVILGIDHKQVAGRYGTDVSKKLDEYGRVVVK